MTYINPQGKAFRHLDRLAKWQAGEKPAPVTVEWDLSNRCALGCQDCHFAHTHVRGPWAVRNRRLPMAFEGTGDLADLRIVARVLQELAYSGVQAIVWSGGGEPTTHPHWRQIVDLAGRQGLQQGMYTLGGLLTEDSAAHLASKAAWVVVSLDCLDAETYSAEKGVSPDRFAAACRGIYWLAQADATVVGVSFLLHQGNYQDAPKMVALARSLGATYTTFRPTIRVAPDRPAVCTDDRRWIEQASLIFDQLASQPDVEITPARFQEYAQWEGHGYDTCYGVRLNTTITPDGRVWVCPQRRGVTALGDLNQESFGVIWARHAGMFPVDAGCRVMCRLHPLNQTLAAIEQPMEHEAFL